MSIAFGLFLAFLGIMNKVQLSYNQVREYILYLERIELISYDRGEESTELQ
jgi:hypothetical protein